MKKKIKIKKKKKVKKEKENFVMTTFLSSLTLKTLLLGPMLELLREIMKNWNTIMAAFIEPGKQLANQTQANIIK